MSRKLFGTDGIRGVANRDLTPELALSLGAAVGRRLRGAALPMRVLLGRDTRRSGPMLASAFSAGACSSGCDVVDLGVIPTGAISYLVRKGGFGLGAVISASHNPAPDNGIKLIATDGRKLAENEERWLEANLDPPTDRPLGGDLGSVGTGEEEVEDYLDMLEAILPGGLDGMRIAVDGAHGAAHRLATDILGRLGADVHAVGISPDGMNINAEGGATKPQIIQDLTIQTKSHVGLSFDGDADRVVFSDEKGRLINGDRTMAIWCLGQAILEPPVVVGTVMSNGGFEQFLTARGINLERTAVGDKYVSARMTELGAKLGGEQSGHLIFADRGVTGDGLITALEFLRVVQSRNRPVSELFDAYEAWPQVLVNVTVSSREDFLSCRAFDELLAISESKLKGLGRVNVRPSGTQPMIRVMVEAEEAQLRDAVASELVGFLERELQGSVYSRVDLTHSLGE